MKKTAIFAMKAQTLCSMKTKKGLQFNIIKIEIAQIIQEAGTLLWFSEASFSKLWG